MKNKESLQLTMLSPPQAPPRLPPSLAYHTPALLPCPCSAQRDTVYHQLLRGMTPESKFAMQAKLVNEVCYVWGLGGQSFVLWVSTKSVHRLVYLNLLTRAQSNCTSQKQLPKERRAAYQALLSSLLLHTTASNFAFCVHMSHNGTPPPQIN